MSQPGGTQSTGMAGAWSAQASDLALQAASAGGDYVGRSSGPADSLLIWTHDLNRIRVQRTFRPEGAPTDLPAVTAMEVSTGNS